MSTAGNLLPRPPEWTEAAACTGMAPLFDSPYSDEDTSAWLARRREAIAVCGTCRVLQQCREYAAENDLTGVWGGRAHGSQHKTHSAAYPDRHLTAHPYLTTDERSTTE
ncbi:WhiB family transcriptional regulator [Rhodococcus sp. IEGM 1408]|uniref:WhiB family transcriptional regulator n=1 Tax=Rhodococcus sp. IEGM 1408 TaxID=3082220 RepID=UPI002952A4DB|nr:WhiB family transcriptional regulator [Rhodococcus sp. IEGM 1408]MDV8000761.1 WhiB family transcriptional regulator [Rhodococcus sp. IEGM 1408]